ncbi:uncharacterized protein Gasu_53300 [Galdieria sulphuraria]|uniref:Pentatricopeptide (PPR) repeat-containing protein n=1 Tax=Galdieria sulphuraria TaxID=130081 RepID=M2WT82_GALSU|nr:uncharacterized protein Gasu_53300 [Galdieria sulphuraria]EME27110.1 hypothetical protein Gasu_53300 [Galdieria sulphuraria]|eukprot:XP_005703630.1 hypothetical protein Gasu_53300 [Galdieria sulphuraria]
MFCAILKRSSWKKPWLPLSTGLFLRSSKTLLQKRITKETLDDFTNDELFEYIKERTSRPGQYPLHYEKLRQYCYRVRTPEEFDRAYELIFDYHKKLLPVHGKVSRQLIESEVRFGNPKRAVKAIEYWRFLGMKPGIYGFSVLLTALSKQGDVESMKKLWYSSLDGCVELNTHMLTEYVRRFAKVKAYEMVEEVLKIAKERNVRLRTPGFLVLASTKLQDGRPEEALQVLDRMKEFGCLDNSSTKAMRKEIEDLATQKLSTNSNKEEK